VAESEPPLNSEPESAPILTPSYTPFPSSDDFRLLAISEPQQLGSALVWTPLPPRPKFTELFAAHYDQVAIALLVMQYVFVNIAFSTFTQNIVLPKDLAAPFFSLIILGVWVTGDLLSTGRWTLPRQGLVLAMVAALVYWALLVPVGPSTASAIQLWGRVCGFFIQVWATLRFVTTWPRAKVMITAVLVTNVLMVTYGFTQLMENDLLVAFGVIPDWGSPVFSTTAGCPCQTALVFITVLPLIFGKAMASCGWKERLVFGALLIANVIEVYMSGHRGAYIALAVTPPFLLLLALPWARKSRHAGRVMATLLVLLVLSGLCWYGYFLMEQRAEIRPTFARMAIDGTAREPWIGRGLATFNWLMPETRPPWYHRSGISHNTDHAHNELLNWLHDSGLLGLSFILWMMVLFAVTGWRSLRRLSRSPHYWFALGAFIGPWSALVFSLFSVEALWAGTGVTAALVVGLVLACGNLAPSENFGPSPITGPEPDRPRRLYGFRAGGAVLVSAVLVPAYIVFAHHIWNADRHLRNTMAYTGGGAGSKARAVKEAEAARRLNYTESSNYYALAYTYLAAGKLHDAMNVYRDLQSFAPNYAQIHINLAFLNDSAGYRTASAWERDRAATIEHNTQNHRDAANYWLQLGDTSRAIAHLRLCFTIERDRTDDGYHYWLNFDKIAADLARAYVSSGHRDLARLELERALRFNPRNFAARLLLIDLQAANSAQRLGLVKARLSPAP
jgi:hypothetical protein